MSKKSTNSSTSSKRYSREDPRLLDWFQASKSGGAVVSNIRPHAKPPGHKKPNTK